MTRSDDLPVGEERRPEARVRSLLTRRFAAPLVAAALLHAAAACATTPAPREEAAAFAERAAWTYERSTSYRIEFVQESYWALADTLQVSHGVLIARPPSSVSITYDDGGRIVARGESLWIYVPQTNQFFSSTVDSSDVAIDPARILRQYRPDEKEPFAESEPGSRTIVLRPLNAISEPSRLSVTIDVERFIVTAMSANSSSGDRTTYRMLDTAFNVAVPPSEFAPRRPAGAELIRGQTHGSP